MQLNDDAESYTQLITTAHEYYKSPGKRQFSVFEQHWKEGEERYFIRFLLDRKHVVEYSIIYERRVRGWLSSVALGIGPAYFSPANFWSYKESERFTLQATTEAIVHNLKLLDEFLAHHS